MKYWIIGVALDFKTANSLVSFEVIFWSDWTMNSLLWQVVITASSSGARVPRNALRCTSIMLGYKTIHLYKIYKEYEVVISVGN